MMSSRYNTDYDLSELITNDGQSKENARGEYIVVCPICKARKEREEPGRVYEKRKLYIDSTMSVGHCFVCESVFLDKSGLAKMRAHKSWTPLSIDEPEFISIPYMRPDQHNEQSHRYLVNRCPQLYTDRDMSKLGFYCVEDKVVIRFLLNGDNYYYQLRYLDPKKSNNGMKYYMPTTGEMGKPLYFAGGEYNPYKKTILVEGVFTALVEKLLLPDCNVVAVLGHYLTPFQKNMLQSLGAFNGIYIHMDETQMSWDVKRTIWKDFRNVRVIPNYDEKLDSEELIRYSKITPDEYQAYLAGYVYQSTSLSVA